MAIDVYTADLAQQLRNVDRESVDALVGEETHPLDAVGLRRSRRGINVDAPRFGLLGGRAQVKRAASKLGLRAGRPFFSVGPCWMMDPDRFDPLQWHRLESVASDASSDRALDARLSDVAEAEVLDRGFLGTAWDEFPGITFARAIEYANTIVVPASTGGSFVAGRLAVTTAGEGRGFLAAVMARLGMSASSLEQDYDPARSDEVNGVLYNLRLLSHHLREAEKTGRPVGVWG